MNPEDICIQCGLRPKLLGGIGWCHICVDERKYGGDDKPDYEAAVQLQEATISRLETNNANAQVEILSLEEEIEQVEKERNVARGQVATMKGMLEFQREAIEELRTRSEQAEAHLVNARQEIRALEEEILACPAVSYHTQTPEDISAQRRTR
jgi:chromosome segregation ATPase